MINPIFQSAMIGIYVLYMANLYNYILLFRAIDTYVLEVFVLSKVGVVSCGISTKY